jgi:hypothetical protein
MSNPLQGTTSWHITPNSAVAADFVPPSATLGFTVCARHEAAEPRAVGRQESLVYGMLARSIPGYYALLCIYSHVQGSGGDMTKQRVAFLLSLVFVIVLAGALFYSRKAYAQSGAVIPKSFGSCRGGVAFPDRPGAALIFEDSAGTIRLINPSTGELVAQYPRK